MLLKEGSTLFRGKKPTNLYFAVQTLLLSKGPVRSKDLLHIVSSWHNLVPLMSKQTPEGYDYFRNETKNGGSFWYLTEEGYNQFVKETGKHPEKPDYLKDEEVYFVDYDMELESMKIEDVKQILKENGYILNEWDGGYEYYYYIIDVRMKDGTEKKFRIKGDTEREAYLNIWDFEERRKKKDIEEVFNYDGPHKEYADY